MVKTAAARTVEDIAVAVPHLIRLPAGRVWIDYDAEADVLYIALKARLVDQSAIDLQSGSHGSAATREEG